jgi:3'(2'), 5'-bisphosphate nucleotidase
MQPNYARLIELARKAGDAILDIYNRSEFTIIEKHDASPLTQADITSHDILVAGLKDILDIPVISEEAPLPEQEERAQWTRFWLIDPLDGTKEFIDRNGEFTVNIALIEDGEPIFGLIYLPVDDQCYYGGDGKAFLKVGEEPASRLKTTSPLKRIREKDCINLYASRRHASEQLVHLCNRLEEKLAHVQLVAMGSSIKFAYLAGGKGDVYPRYGNVSEWDIAAGHAILRCVGGDILSKQYEAIRYGRKPSMVVPGFFAVSYVDFDWRPLLLT